MSTKSDADVDAQIEAEMAELHAELGGSDDSVEEAPEGDVDDPGADEESEDEESEEEEPEALEEPDGEAARAEVAKLFADGDLKGACEKLGLDPAIFKVNNRQFAAARKAESEAKRQNGESAARDAQATAKLAQAQQLHAKAEEMFGPVVAGSRAYAVDRDMTKAKAAVELMFNDTFENVVKNIQSGAKVLSGPELEIAQLKRQLEEEKAAKAREDQTATERAAEAAELAKLETMVAKTPLADVEGAAADILKLYKASYNKALGKPTKTIKECYGAVKAEYARKAAQLARLAPKSKVDEEPEEPAAKPRRGAPARKPLAGGKTPSKPITPEDQMAAEMRIARREYEAEQRRSRRK